MENVVPPFWVVDIDGCRPPLGPVLTLEEAEKIANNYEKHFGVRHTVFDDEIYKQIYVHDPIDDFEDIVWG